MPVMIVTFLAGVSLIVYSVTHDKSASEIPEAPAERTIRAHASALPDDTFAANPETAPASDTAAQAAQEGKTDPAQAAPKAPAAQATGKTVAAPKANLKAPPIDTSVGATAAMYNLVKMPVAEGATPPQTGKYTVISAPIQYDENVAPELIAAAEATT